MVVLGIISALALLGWYGFTHHPWIAGGAVGLVVVGWFVYSAISWRNTNREWATQAEAKRRAEQAAYEKHQADLRAIAHHLVSTASKLSLEVVENAWRADAALDRAESEFADGAFAPFWDAIEVSTNSLARIDEAVREVAEAGEKYMAVAHQLDSPPPDFVIDTSALPDISGIARRMHGIVRPAQKDYEFASIFEKRKTNQILVSGFGTLALAIAEMASRLDRTLSGLDRILKGMTGRPR